MHMLPPIVIECPECGERYLLSRNSTIPSEEATLFSDGYFIDETNWRTPAIIGCVTCELGFFPQNGKLIAEPDWEEFNKQWAHIKKAEPPTAGSLALELRTRKIMAMDAELAIRKEFWYAGFHTETGRILMEKNEKFRNYWNDSREKLEALLSTTHEESLLLKAEINRQTGRFKECIRLLSAMNNPWAQKIVAQASLKNSALFQLN
ncbi:MAG: hypothetical protein JXR22_06025 [Prolixibacteraceae bacterium]|nr:hypothetical protein [Prolixibacteraceae bacterium]